MKNTGHRPLASTRTYLHTYVNTYAHNTHIHIFKSLSTGEAWELAYSAPTQAARA